MFSVSGEDDEGCQDEQDGGGVIHLNAWLSIWTFGYWVNGNNDASYDAVARRRIELGLETCGA